MIGVIVPVYNVEKYIRRCIGSILKQSYSDFKLILVDDGSTDKSGAICDEYQNIDSRIEVIHKKNGGQSSARNVGINRVLENEMISWITFIDSDDWVASNYLYELYCAACESKSLISACAFVRTNGEQTADQKIKSFCIFEPEVYWMKQNANPSIACAKIYSKAIWEHVRYPEGRIFEDEATIYKILFSVEQVAVINEALYFYFYNSDSTTGKRWNLKNVDKVTALGEQKKFFKTNHYKAAYRKSVGMYLYFIQDSIDHIKQDDNISNRNAIKLKWEMKAALIDYFIKDRNLGIRVEDYCNVAFPVLSKVYMYTKAFSKRIKRKKG